MRNRGLAVLCSGLLLAYAGAGADAPALAATSSRSAAGLVAADKDRFRAMVERDIPALDKALAQELVYVHSSSGRQSKAEHLGDTASGKAVYARIDVKEQVPRIYGKIGFIQGIATFTTGAMPGPPFTLRYTDAYVWRGGRWQMVAWHCTRIPEAGSTAPEPRKP